MSGNGEIKFGGVHHVALVCRDMARTVHFYRDVLGMPLVKTLEIPGGGQHFFFDCGNGNCIAFFWFPDAPPAMPGIGQAGAVPGLGDIRSSHGSMNHLALTVPLDQFDASLEKLKAKGIETGPVLNHDDSETTVAAELHDGVYVRSVYFQDPDGVLLELAAWTRELGPGDVTHTPATEARPNTTTRASAIAGSST